MLISQFRHTKIRIQHIICAAILHCILSFKICFQAEANKINCSAILRLLVHGKHSVCLTNLHIVDQGYIARLNATENWFFWVQCLGSWTTLQPIPSRFLAIFTYASNFVSGFSISDYSAYFCKASADFGFYPGTVKADKHGEICSPMWDLSFDNCWHSPQYRRVGKQFLPSNLVSLLLVLIRIWLSPEDLIIWPNQEIFYCSTPWFQSPFI